MNNNPWSLCLDQRNEVDLDLAFLGIKSGDQIVKDAIESFSKDLDELITRQTLERRRIAQDVVEAA